jgi:hypothetical protein
MRGVTASNAAKAIMEERDERRLISDFIAPIEPVASKGINQHTPGACDYITPSKKRGTDPTYR